MSFRSSTDRAGVAAVLVIVWASAMLWVPPKYPFAHVFSHDVDSPGIALQMSRNAGEIEQVLHRSEPAATQATHNLRVANQLDLVFIPVYVFFLWSLVRVFTNRTRVVTLFIIGTGLSDYAEDWQIFRALNGENAMIFIPSLAKWGALGLVLFGTGIILSQSTAPVYSLATKRLLAIAYFISGLLLLESVAQGQRIGYSLIELAMQLFSLLVTIHVFGLLGRYFEIHGIKQRYVENFCEKRKERGMDSLMAVKPEIAE